MATLEPQEQLVDEAVEEYRRTVARGRGRLLFIAGAEGSGRSRTLARIVERLSYEEPPALLVAGSLKADSFQAWPNDVASQRHMVENLHRIADQREPAQRLAEWLGLGAAFQPYLGLLSAFVSVAAVGVKLRARLLQGPLGTLAKTDVPDLLLDLLQQEADRRRETENRGPVVLLLDDLHAAWDPWLDVFLDRVSLVLPVDLYALVIVTLVGPPSAAQLEDESSALTRITRRELGRSADWRWLRPLTGSEPEAWLGPMEEGLGEELATLTQGNAELADELWKEWRARGLVTRRSLEARWRLAREADEPSSRRVDGLVERRLEELAGGDKVLVDRLRRALCLGALEGRTFTAEAVALAEEPERDADVLIDELDTTVAISEERPGGLLREAGWTVIGVPGAEPLNLGRYEFVSRFYWRALQRLVTREQLPELSRRLAEALVRLYGHEQALVSRLLSELYSAAGDTEQAARHRSWAQLQATADGLELLGTVLLSTPTEDWQRSDFIYAAWRLDEVASRLRDYGRLAAARPLNERALATRERVLGPDHPDTAVSLNHLGLLLVDQSELADASPLLERALAIRERVLGPDHPDTATSLDNLASLRRAQGEVAAARPLYERALAIRERVLGPDHPATASSLSNLAGLLQAQGERAEARPLYERALAIRERVLGPDHPDTALSLNNLAVAFSYQGDLASARPLYERALAIREQVQGPDHPDTAVSLNNLAGLLRDGGDVAAARPLYERALAITERVLGPDHPDTARSLSNLAVAFSDEGNLAAARPLFERALAIREQVQGPDHPDTAESLDNLAGLRRAEGEVAAAGPLYERALAIRERVLGPDHPDTAVSLNNLGLLLRAKGLRVN